MGPTLDDKNFSFYISPDKSAKKKQLQVSKSVPDDDELLFATEQNKDEIIVPSNLNLQDDL